MADDSTGVRECDSIARADEGRPPRVALAGRGRTGTARSAAAGRPPSLNSKSPGSSPVLDFGGPPERLERAGDALPRGSSGVARAGSLLSEKSKSDAVMPPAPPTLLPYGLRWVVDPWVDKIGRVVPSGGALASLRRRAGAGIVRTRPFKKDQR